MNRGEKKKKKKEMWEGEAASQRKQALGFSRGTGGGS